MGDGVDKCKVTIAFQGDIGLKADDIARLNNDSSGGVHFGLEKDGKFLTVEGIECDNNADLSQEEYNNVVNALPPDMRKKTIVYLQGGRKGQSDFEFNGQNRGQKNALKEFREKFSSGDSAAGVTGTAKRFLDKSGLKLGEKIDTPKKAWTHAFYDSTNDTLNQMTDQLFGAAQVLSGDPKYTAFAGMDKDIKVTKSGQETLFDYKGIVAGFTKIKDCAIDMPDISPEKLQEITKFFEAAKRTDKSGNPTLLNNWLDLAKDITDANDPMVNQKDPTGKGKVVRGDLDRTKFSSNEIRWLAKRWYGDKYTGSAEQIRQTARSVMLFFGIVDFHAKMKASAGVVSLKYKDPKFQDAKYGFNFHVEKKDGKILVTDIRPDKDDKKDADLMASNEIALNHRKILQHLIDEDSLIIEADAADRGLLFEALGLDGDGKIKKAQPKKATQNDEETDTDNPFQAWWAKFNDASSAAVE